MSLKGDITVMLRAHAPLVALLGSPTAVWHRRAPAGAPLPRVIFFRLPFDGDSHLGGASTLERPLYQFDCIAATSALADQIADMLDTLVNGFRGQMGGKWCSGFTRRSRRDDDFEVTKGGEQRHYMVSTDYKIGWKKSA